MAVIGTIDIGDSETFRIPGRTELFRLVYDPVIDENVVEIFDGFSIGEASDMVKLPIPSVEYDGQAVTIEGHGSIVYIGTVDEYGAPGWATRKFDLNTSIPEVNIDIVKLPSGYFRINTELTEDQKYSKVDTDTSITIYAVVDIENTIGESEYTRNTEAGANFFVNDLVYKEEHVSYSTYSINELGSGVSIDHSLVLIDDSFGNIVVKDNDTLTRVALKNIDSVLPMTEYNYANEYTIDIGVGIGTDNVNPSNVVSLVISGSNDVSLFHDKDIVSYVSSSHASTTTFISDDQLNTTNYMLDSVVITKDSENNDTHYSPDIAVALDSSDMINII